MKILLVDDDVAGLFSLKELVEIDGFFKVDTASTFDEAIHLLEGNLYECIITDIFLDRNTGYDVLKYAKGKNPIVPVIGMTGFNEIVDFRDEFDAVFLKPYPFRELLDKAHDLVKRRHFVQIISTEEDLKGLDTFFNNLFDYNIYTTEEYVDKIRSFLHDKLYNYRGVILPGIISGSEVLREGAMIVRHSKSAEISILNLDDPKNFENSHKRAFMCFYDHNCNINKLEDVLKTVESKYFYGVGCGYKGDKNNAPAIFDKNGFHKNSALVLQLDRKFENFHYLGFEPAYGPLRLKFDNGLLAEINGENPYDFYLEVVKGMESEPFLEHKSFGIHYPLGLLDGDTGHFTLKILERFRGKGWEIALKGGIFSGSSLGYIFQHKKRKQLFDDLLKRFKARINVGNVLVSYPFDAYEEFGKDHFREFMEIILKHLPREAVMGFISRGFFSSELAKCKNAVSHLGLLVGNVE